MTWLKMLFAVAPKLGLSVIAGPAGAIVTAGATVFQALVAFFQTTLGRYVGAGLIGLGLFVAGDIHRGHSDAAEWRARVAASQAAAKARDAEISRQVSADAQQRIRSLQDMTDQLQTRIAEYEKILAEPAPTVAPVAGKCPATACKLGPRDVRGLLNLK